MEKKSHHHHHQRHHLTNATPMVVAQATAAAASAATATVMTTTGVQTGGAVGGVQIPTKSTMTTYTSNANANANTLTKCATFMHIATVPTTPTTTTTTTAIITTQKSRKLSNHGRYNADAASSKTSNMTTSTINASGISSSYHSPHAMREMHTSTRTPTTTTTTATATATGAATTTTMPHEISNMNSNMAMLTQMQMQRSAQSSRLQANDMAERIMRMSRRGALKDLSTMQAKALSSDKNGEAIRELETRIPELGKIFDIGGRIGSGTFSTVLLATLKRERVLPECERRRFAIKHHNPTNHPDRIIRELECMFKIGGTDNVIGINCCIRYNDSIAFIMPYLAHDRFHDIYRSLTVNEVRDYMRNLLIALRHVHRFNVIHRDVKPSNILYNRRTRQFLLCDFGLAQRLAADGSVVQSSEMRASLTPTHTPAPTPTPTKSKTPTETTEPTEYTGKRSAASAKLHDNIKRMRAMGGGGGVDGTVIISPAPSGHGGITSAELVNTLTSAGATANEPRATFNVNANGVVSRENYPRTQLSSYVSTSVVTKKEIAAQKADTSRLISRLRHLSPSMDINNYVVSTNTTRKEVHASRAGTPGYRPPEVLLRYPHQTTAVDVWAAGVIMLSIMSTMHPFFKAPNDCTALSELINLFGDVPIRKTALLLNRLVMLTQKLNPLDLRRVCMRFRHSDAFTSPEIYRRYRHSDGTCDLCHNCEQNFYNCLCEGTHFKLENQDHLDIFPASAYDLLRRLLEVNPVDRITAEEALNHPFFTESSHANGAAAHSITTEGFPSANVAANAAGAAAASVTAGGGPRTLKAYTALTASANGQQANQAPPV